jgi:hypothetical protein
MKAYTISEFNLDDVFVNIEDEKLKDTLSGLLKDKSNSKNSMKFSSLIKKEEIYTSLKSYITENQQLPETSPKKTLYYNYVLGYSNENKLLLRLGEFKNTCENFSYEMQQYMNFILQNRLKDGKYRTVSYESYYGLKHIQLASDDIKILFSGILVVKGLDITISPMSGTWVKNMEQISSNCHLINALNILNILCIKYAFKKIEYPPEWIKRANISEDCLNHYFKKYKGIQNSSMKDKCETDIPTMTCISKEIEEFRESLKPPSKKCRKN